MFTKMFTNMSDKAKLILKVVISVTIAALTALGTALGLTSCTATRKYVTKATYVQVGDSISQISTEVTETYIGKKKP